VLVADDRLHARPGSGQFLARKAGQSAQPLGRLAPEFDPKRNFGVKLG
jgi:dihydropyrimidinase